MNFDQSYPVYHPITSLENDVKSLEAYLEPTQGEPVMRPEEMKLAIVTLKMALDAQIALNREVVAKITKLESKKNRRFWKK